MTIEFYKFANILDKWMKKSNLSKAALSDKTGIPVPYISNLLKGIRTPSKDKLKILAEALDSPLEELAAASGYSMDDMDHVISPHVIHNILQEKSKEPKKTDEIASTTRLSRDYSIVTMMPMYDLPAEFLPLCEDYRSLPPEKREAWMNTASVLMAEIKKLQL